MSDQQKFDVVVLGAGTSGAAATYQLAKRGLRVCCLERTPIDEAGARWVNEVPGWMFDAAGIQRPEDDEVLEMGGRSHIIAGWGPRPSMYADAPDGLSVDMRKLVARLQRLAQEAGAKFVDRVNIEGTDGRQLRTNLGTFSGDWLVDATGIAGREIFDRPAIDPQHLCAAAQAVYQVADQDEAFEYFRANNAVIGEILCFTSVAGGYSVVNVRSDEERLSVLTGSIPATGAPSGKRLLEEFVRGQHWIGHRHFGGWRAIPICSPFYPLFRDRVAFLGDAGCQVFPAHGSGIGSGLIAAKLLAEALAQGRGVEGYAASWHRKYGALHSAYDLMRRFSQTITAEGLGDMMRHFLLDRESLEAGLDQRFPPLSVGKVHLFLNRIRHVPHVAKPLLRVLLRIPRLRMHHALYLPNRPAYQRLWWSRLNRLMA